MYKFLLGGWVARPSAFYFVRSHWFLGLFCSLCLSLSPWLSFVCSVFRCLTLLGLAFVVAMFNYIQPNRTWSPVPVLGMPSISALLDRYSLPNKITPCIFTHFLYTLLYSYAMFKLTN